MLQDADPWIHPWTFPPGDWENSPHKWWWKVREDHPKKENLHSGLQCFLGQNLFRCFLEFEMFQWFFTDYTMGFITVFDHHLGECFWFTFSKHRRVANPSDSGLGIIVILPKFIHDFSIYNVTHQSVAESFNRVVWIICWGDWTTGCYQQNVVSEISKGRQQDVIFVGHLQNPSPSWLKILNRFLSHIVDLSKVILFLYTMINHR